MRKKNYYNILFYLAWKNKINKMISAHTGEYVGKEEYLFIVGWSTIWYSHYGDNEDIPQKLIKQVLGYRSLMPTNEVWGVRLQIRTV